MPQNGPKREKLKIMVISAHPHDFTHCAGTCGIHASKGDDVTVVAMMNGEKMHNEQYYSELIKPESERDPAIVNISAKEYGRQKEQEFIRSVELFGIKDVRILRAPEPYRYFEAPEYAEKISELLLEIRPDILITQSPYLDGNLVGRNNMSNIMLDDHSQTAIAVHEGLYHAENPDYALKVAPHRVALVLYMGVYFNRDQVDFYVDITDFYDKRVEAEAMFASQGHTREYARRRVETTVGWQGYQCKTAYTEGYVRSTFELYDEIPISPVSIRRARESRLSSIRRIEGEKL